MSRDSKKSLVLFHLQVCDTILSPRWAGIKDEIIHIISGGDNVPSPSPFVPVFNELNEHRTLAKANGLVALVIRLVWLEQVGLCLNARVML